MKGIALIAADEQKRGVKAQRAEEQREEKAKRDQERAKLAEEKRAQKEDKRRSKDNKTKGNLLGVFGLGSSAAAGVSAPTGDAAATADVEVPILDPIPTTEPLATTPGLTEQAPEVPFEAIEPEEKEDVFVSPVEPTSTSPDKDDGDGLLAHLHSPKTDVTLKPLKETPAESAIEPEPKVIAATDSERATSPTSPTKESKVKSWWTKRFSRSNKPAQTSEDIATEEAEKKPAGFVGGASLTGAAASTTSPSDERPREDSMREIAMVGRTSTNETGDGGLYSASEPEVSPPAQEDLERRGRSSPSVSSISWSDDDQAEQTNKPRGRTGLRDRLMGKTTSKVSNEEDKEDEFEEARDTFEEEKLAPPPKLTTVSGDAGARPGGSPIRDSKFSEDL